MLKLKHCDKYSGKDVNVLILVRKDIFKYISKESCVSPIKHSSIKIRNSIRKAPPQVHGFISGLSVLFYWSALVPLLYCCDYCSFVLYFTGRELSSFFSSSIFWNSLRRLYIISSLYVQWNSLVKLSSPGVCLLGVFVWFGLGVLFVCF